MDLFSDILQPLPSPVPISTVVAQVSRSLHHPESPKPSRAPQTSRLGLPSPRQDPWRRVGRALSLSAANDHHIAIR